MQTAPDAYEDEELIAAQKDIRMAILQEATDAEAAKKSHSWNAKTAFEKAGFRQRFYTILDRRALPQIMQREIRLSIKNPK